MIWEVDVCKADDLIFVLYKPSSGEPQTITTTLFATGTRYSCQAAKAAVNSKRPSATSAPTHEVNCLKFFMKYNSGKVACQVADLHLTLCNPSLHRISAK